MNRWPFVVWMLGYPVASALSDYLGMLADHGVFPIYSANVSGATAATNLAIWFIVGTLLYRGAGR